MLSTGYLDTNQRHPGLLALAIAINLGVVGSLLAYKTVIDPPKGDGPTLIDIFKPPPPVPRDPPKPHQQPRTTADPQPVPPPPFDASTARTDGPTFVIPPAPPPPFGSGTIVEPVKPPPIVETPANFDRRYADDVQPPYPPGLQRQEIEGSVTVRVQIGPNGRVLAVELVRTDDPGFFEATRRQALSRWRFKPAMRDGEPVASWVTKTVRFRIES